MLVAALKACGYPVLKPQHTAHIHRLAMASSNAFVGPGSEQYRQQSCKQLGQCSKDTPRLEGIELEQALRALPAWQPDETRQSLSRQFTAKNFVAAIRFFGEVANIAEEEGHHPDLHLTDYREVKVQVSTHAIKGLSLYDVVLAAKIDALPVEYSPKWLREQKH